MSRFLIFDTSAVADSKGAVIDHTVFADAPNVKRSVPVRLYGPPDGDIRYWSLEFVLEATAGVGESIALLWSAEYQSDAPSIVIPTLRSDPNISPNTKPWAAEQTQETSVSGAVAHYDVTRTMTCVTTTVLTVCKIVPLTVHALFGRIKINVATAPTNAHRLRVFSIIGGQPEEEAAEGSTAPWVGSAA